MILAGVVSGLAEALTERAQLLESDVYLRGLAHKLPQYLLGSRSDNTRHKYECYFKTFKAFMLKHGKPYLPCISEHVALFVVHLLENDKSYAVITSFVYSIKWIHNLYNYPDPTGSAQIKDLLSCSKRKPSTSRGKKEVVSSNDIKLLFEKYKSSTDCKVVRDLSMIVIAFSGFLRYDELSSILCSDVKFRESHISILLTKSKTDQFRDGNEIVIAKTDSVACPYKALSEYVRLFNVDMSQNNFLFRAIYKTKSKVALRGQNKRLSYTRVRELLVSRLYEVVPKSTKLGLHSLRSGGVSAAADAGVEERLAQVAQ